MRSLCENTSCNSVCRPNRIFLTGVFFCPLETSSFNQKRLMTQGLQHCGVNVSHLCDMIITLMFEVIRLFQIGLLTEFRSLTLPTSLRHCRHCGVDSSRQLTARVLAVQRERDRDWRAVNACNQLHLQVCCQVNSKMIYIYTYVKLSVSTCICSLYISIQGLCPSVHLSICLQVCRSICTHYSFICLSIHRQLIPTCNLVVLVE